jgi:hypothetical protein
MPLIAVATSTPNTILTEQSGARDQRRNLGYTVTLRPTAA